jgi:hypothetical protein
MTYAGAVDYVDTSCIYIRAAMYGFRGTETWLVSFRGTETWLVSFCGTQMWLVNFFDQSNCGQTDEQFPLCILIVSGLWITIHIWLVAKKKYIYQFSLWFD